MPSNTTIKDITRDVVQRLNKGDLDAFNTIYHASWIYLCSVSMYYTHDSGMASSIVNDVFISLWEHRKDIRWPVLSWLRTCVRNSSVSYLRSSLSNYQIHSEEQAWENIENNILSDDNPLEALEGSELEGQVRSVIAALPPKCREVIEKCLYEGKSYEEISLEMGISQSTVRVHVKNALDILRNSISIPIWVLVAYLLQ